MKKFLTAFANLCFLSVFAVSTVNAQKIGNQLNVQGKFRTATGEKICLKEGENGKPTVFLFFNPDCSIGFNFESVQQAIAQFGDVANFYGVVSGGTHNASAVRAHIESLGIEFPVIMDRHVRLSAMLNTELGPKAFVLDGDNVLRYRGAVESRHADQPKLNYLYMTLNSILAGEQVAISRTSVADCYVFPWVILEGGAEFRGTF